MSNMIEHAERELRLAGLFDGDSDYDGMLGRAVMKLVRVHSEEGHSGMSHHMTMDLFRKVANFKTLSPITSDPSEWNEVETGVWQSRRQPSCFSRDGGKTFYDLDWPIPVWRRALRRIGLNVAALHGTRKTADVKK